MIHGQTHIKFTLHVFVSVDPKDPYSKKKLGMCKKATLSVKILLPPPPQRTPEYPHYVSLQFIKML